MTDPPDTRPPDDSRPRKGVGRHRRPKKPRRLSLGTLTQATSHLLLALRTWDELQEHEALITRSVMSALAKVLDVIGQLAG